MSTSKQKNNVIIIIKFYFRQLGPWQLGIKFIPFHLLITEGPEGHQHR